MNITTELNNWSPSNDPNLFFRLDVDKDRVYRKELSPEYFGGYRILYVPCGSRIAAEWMKTYFN